MWVEVDDLDVITLGTPPPPQELVLVLSRHQALEAVPGLVGQHGVSRVEP